MKLSETANILKDKNSFDMMICVVSPFVLPAAVKSHKLAYWQGFLTVERVTLMSLSLA